MRKVLIIEADYYKNIADMLRQGAQETLKEHNIEHDIQTVPGALEIPATLNFIINGNKNYDAYIVLGCVIRGETSHYDIVCNESARGVYDLVLKNNIALGNGILTVENQQQAVTRADPMQKNKGRDAAVAALHMLALKEENLND